MCSKATSYDISQWHYKSFISNQTISCKTTCLKRPAMLQSPDAKTNRSDRNAEQRYEDESPQHLKAVIWQFVASENLKHEQQKMQPSRNDHCLVLCVRITFNPVNQRQNVMQRKCNLCKRTSAVLAVLMLKVLINGHSKPIYNCTSYIQIQSSCKPTWKSERHQNRRRRQ